MTTGTDLELSPLVVAETLLHGSEVDIVSSDAMQDDMVARILSGETLQDAFQGFESTSAKDVEGVMLDVTGVAWMKSAFKDGPKVYALLRCTLVESKQNLVVSMGGRTTMASFLWAQQHEAMPIRGAFVSSRSNSDPEKMYWSFKLATE